MKRLQVDRQPVEIPDVSQRHTNPGRFMSDPDAATQANPHPVSGHRTPSEIAKDEAGRIGHADTDEAGKDVQSEKSPPPLPQGVDDELHRAPPKAVRPMR